MNKTLVIKSHRLRAKLITVTAVAIIFVAVVFSVFRFAIPYIPDFKNNIEQTLGEKLGVVVEVGFIDADIYWLIPHLKLLEVNVYEKENGRHFLHFDEISLSLNWLDSVRHLKPRLGFVALSGVDLDVVRKSNGQFELQGFAMGSSGTDNPDVAMSEFMNVINDLSFYVMDSRLRWTDEMNNNQTIDLRRVNITFLNQGGRHEVALDVELPAIYGQHLQLLSQFDGDLSQPDTWRGEIYSGFMNLRIKKWIDDYWQYVDFTASGRVDGDLWIGFESKKIKYISSYIDASELSIHYLDDDIRTWNIDYLTGNFRWQQILGGWTFDARDLDIGHDSGRWPFPAALTVAMDTKEQVVDVQANFLRVESLSYVTGLVNSMFAVDGFDWQSDVATYNPVGDLFDFQLNIPLEHPERFKVNSRFYNMGYTSSSDAPSVSGLDGVIEYDGQGTLLKLDSQDVVLDFNGLFRNPMVLSELSGELGIHHVDRAWQLTSNYLDIRTPHIETRSRVDVVVPDTGPVYMDMVSEFLRGDAAFTGQYLPVAIMSDEAVNWLDKSIVKGDISYGGFVFHGNFDDYPFDQGEGVMEVLFNLRNATLDYMPDWPPLENLWSMVRFYNKSMTIEKGRGKIFDADFLNTRVAIEDFSNLHVAIKGEVISPLSELLVFVDNSPLENILGSYITKLQAEGQSRLALDIQIPVDGDGELTVDGLLDFNKNEIFFPREKYRIKDLNGQLKFSESSVEAKGLYASLGDSPVGIDVESVNGADSPLTRISLDTYASIKSLLAPVPVLEDYLQGKSEWKINIDIPLVRKNRANKLDILAMSDLKGVSSVLPGSFAKSRKQSGKFNFHLAVKDDDSLGIDLAYGGQFDLGLEYRKDKWFVNIDSDVIKGRLRMADSVNYPISLNLDYLNLSAFTGAGSKSTDKQLKPVDIPSIELQVAKLDWKHWQFKDVNLQTQKTQKGMQIDHLELHGPAVSILASGSWDSGWRYPHTTKLKFKITSTDLGRCLSTLDITKSIIKSDGSAEGAWTWHAAPYNFSWELLEGQLSFNLDDGSLRDIDPGAGRVLGLLNFETLLSFDFGGQVAEGFSFDEMKASFVFANGMATTENFEIEGKAADVS
ncbi:MAG: DUF3971 domain-containing protein, partial [Gammaproteobacteria bacterium]|nr:DUF3971 domain-containing protein [Gammaproteobacteria bacterium]